MKQSNKVVIGVLIWGCFVLLFSYMYTIRNIAETGTIGGDDLDHLRDKMPHSRRDVEVYKRDLVQMLRSAVSWLGEDGIEQLEHTGLDFRGLMCFFMSDHHGVQCVDEVMGNICPRTVEPIFLSLAAGQSLCQPDQSHSSYCTVECHSSGLVEWKAHSHSWCAENKLTTSCLTDPTCCPPHFPATSYQQLQALLGIRAAKVKERTDSQWPGAADSENDKKKKEKEEARLLKIREVKAKLQEEKRLADEKLAKEKEEQEKEEEKENEKRPPSPAVASDGFRQGFLGQDQLSAGELATLKERGFNLRGLQCQYKPNNEVVCFRQDNQAREVCPAFVTPAFLSLGAGQWPCMAASRDKFYCTAMCQEGSDEVKWNAHEISWCEKHKGDCPKRNYDVAIGEFEIPPFEELKGGEIAGACSGGGGVGGQPVHRERELLSELTVGILSRQEYESLRDSLDTWARGGFLEAVGEVIVFLNERNDKMNELVARYSKPPYNVVVMGNQHNHGITHAMNWLAGNASKPYFLFMEKDFQLVENRACVVEQLSNGLDLLRNNHAQVVKFRSRRHPGFPNWVDQFYRGHEDDCITSRQPNLMCNVYHWVEDPDERWPKLFWRCDPEAKDGDPIFYCSDSYYCNWTNNPVMFLVKWWTEEYVQGRFAKANRQSPYNHLEGYMNWEPHAWNDCKWTIAQGEGLFTHRDRNNYGT